MKYQGVYTYRTTRWARWGEYVRLRLIRGGQIPFICKRGVYWTRTPKAYTRKRWEQREA